MASRESAYAQVAAYVQGLLAKDPSTQLAGWENDFNGYWNNASRDSGAYQSGPNGTPFAGSIYDRSWDQVWPEFKAQLDARAGSTNYRTVDSQSAEGNTLYGSASGNATNTPGGALTPSAYIPLTVTKPQPPALASAVTTLGATAPSGYTPTVGPTGLAYQDDPINYSTMQQGDRFGYSQGAILPSGNYSSGYADAPVAAAGGAPSSGMFGSLNPMLILGVAAVAAFFLLKK